MFNSVALRAGRDGTEIVVHGDGRQTRTYGYVDDVTAGIWMAHWSGLGGIFNLAGNEETSVLDTIGMAIKVTGRGIPVRHEGDRAGQILREVVSSERANRELGWVHKTSYADGMQKSWDWLKEAKR